MPNSLLGPRGLLTLNQQKLESIRLVTDGRCLGGEECKLALATFPNLKHLSWTGLSSQVEIESLASLLVQRSHQLEDLEIDVTYYQDLSEDLGHDAHGEDHSAFKVLGFSRCGSGNFPALKRLALAGIEFPEQQMVVEDCMLSHLCDAFNFESLQSLKLQYCDGWSHLITQFNRHPEPLKLRSLELQWACNDNQVDTQEVLVTFLRKVQGLEELFLSTAKSEDTLEIWQAVLHHRTSLRRFVHHQGTIELNDESGNFESFHDSPDLGFIDVSSIEIAPDASLGRLDLVSLGLCCIPSLLASNDSYSVELFLNVSRLTDE